MILSNPKIDYKTLQQGLNPTLTGFVILRRNLNIFQKRGQGLNPTLTGFVILSSFETAQYKQYVCLNPTLTGFVILSPDRK